MGHDCRSLKHNCSPAGTFKDLTILWLRLIGLIECQADAMELVLVKQGVSECDKGDLGDPSHIDRRGFDEEARECHQNLHSQQNKQTSFDKLPSTTQQMQAATN